MRRSSRVTLRWLVLAAVVAGFLGGVAPARATGQITDTQVVNGFPETLTFKATVSADRDLKRVELHYTVLPDGTDAIGEATFSAGKTATVEFTLKVNDPPRAYFPAGTTFRYSWEIEDTAGAVTRSEPQDYLFLDNRFEWTPVEGEILTLYYHAGSESYAEELAQVGDEGLARAGELLGVTVPFRVRVFLYGDPDEMEPALQTRSERFSELVTTGGVRVASDLVFVAKGFAETEDTLRHELAHIVTKVAGIGPFGDIPTWLDEGFAVYSQSEPGPGYGGAIEDGIDRDSLLSLRSMGTQSSDPGTVNLFYGQSWSIVKFLVDTYGQPQFAALFVEFKKGATTDQALQAAYGIDTDTLENDWRMANGLPARTASTPTATSTAAPATPAATFTPFTAGSSTASPAPTTTAATKPPTAAGEDDGGGILVPVIVGAAILVMAIALVAGGRRLFGRHS